MFLFYLAKIRIKNKTELFFLHFFFAFSSFYRIFAC